MGAAGGERGGEYFMEKEEPGQEADRMPWYGKRESQRMAGAWRAAEEGERWMGTRREQEKVSDEA